jgi:pimeloyl-ACP methyl ester carboxylesterase
VNRFKSQGYACVALPWPGRDLPVEELRKKHPDPALGRLTLDQVVEAHAQAIRTMDEPPILIGHSMGGLVTQILLNRGLGAAGVAIQSAPPFGVLSTSWPFLKSNWPILDPLSPASAPLQMSFEQFQYAFVNDLPLDEQKTIYEQQAVPESRRVGRGVFDGVAHLDFKKPHPPLLMTAGSNDHIIPASLNKSNFARYRGSPSLSEYKEFPGRCHYGFGQRGWEEMADTILAWLRKQGV